MNKYTLFTPGPVDVPEDVLKEIGHPLVYHREEKFSKLLEQVEESLRKVLYTSGKIFFFTSSGTGAMEAACANILSSGEQPVVAVCGRFGYRWLDLCEVYNTKPVVIKEEYGKSITPDLIARLLKKTNTPVVLFTTLTETSTGALNDIKAIGEISQKYGSFLVIDGVAGIGADFCPQDEWHVDVMVGASQKALMAPPGMSFFSVTERAVKKMRKSDLSKYYFDIAIYEKFMPKHQTPWTPAINTLYGLKRGLDIILEKGIKKNFEDHREVADYVRDRVGKMHLEIFPDNPSNALTVIKMRPEIVSTDIIKKVKEEHGMLFADGQADLKGRIIRIGHMGNYTIRKLSKALDALEKVLNQWRG